ncbi:hypothetical protein HYH03_018789 [Edaphochlamys debaryana]|uniref:magnesium-protoporphyrin IX monomethyl ester (oxidative) cyclase n=1 Tax=Edaphochlamys debaryana TaxID=47281 RepID=A0A836BMS7_9CHLO|nr:hypothetical protein HYH03_018789 [Edaphochlamys debaryana]|eukprot:KAG2482275.1 hypothetical protein HYH03_018789 [Edaphochlamys debaryana]
MATMMNKRVSGSVGKQLPARARVAAVRPSRSSVRVSASAAPAEVDELGFKKMRSGVKVAAEESLLTPRFYTTDFDEMERMFSLEINKNLNMEEFDAMLAEFKTDYNQTHFVRNNTFKDAAKNIQGPARKIFVEFLERSCTAEFSGFLLYKELGRRLKPINPVVAEIFTLMSRDEARHAGFLNKALSDFDLALDLGFLTKNRTYTYFKPKFIIYATYLSEKIGYWRYISIYRHLQRNPDNQLYPLFEYFENWCQDENRHGDFFTAVLKSQPNMIDDWVAKLWSRFFCLSVYITMYLNDHQRSAFYESLGLQTTQFNQHVIIETNKSTERIFPAVPDVENPEFFRRMDELVKLNNKVVEIGTWNVPAPIKLLARAPYVERMVAEIFQVFIMTPKDTGSVDFDANPSAVVY